MDETPTTSEQTNAETGRPKPVTSTDKRDWAGELADMVALLMISTKDTQSWNEAKLLLVSYSEQGNQKGKVISTWPSQDRTENAGQNAAPIAAESATSNIAAP